MTVDNRNPKFDSRNNCNAIIETNTNTLVLGCDATVIPNTVTTLGDNSLKYCAQITSINIPSSVTSIGYDVFAKCFGLESIVIPASVTSIGYNLFDHCQNLSSIRVALGNPVYDSRNNCNAIIETVTADCTDADKDTKCDVCEAVIPEDFFDMLHLPDLFFHRHDVLVFLVLHDQHRDRARAELLHEDVLS
ncbi:MAG: leucine-rich repeat domain-containing protein, partial [Ruminococcus sp.]|nr:leucine-rich repeat domain-containing protein [Ruminococcus sp.]